MGTPVSDKFCTLLSPVVPTGTSVYDKSRIRISYVLYLNKFCSTYGYSRI